MTVQTQITVQRQRASRALSSTPIRLPGRRAAPGRTRWVAGHLVVGMLACAACGVTNEGQLPSDVQDPAAIQTPAGAVGYYTGVLTVAVPSMIDGFLFRSSLVTDEVTLNPVPVGLFDTDDIFINNRQSLAFGNERADSTLHRLRVQARDAREFLNAYAPESSPALRGHMYAMEGYSEIFLADFFCSGIPLSTVDFGGDYTLAAGSSTQEVYAHAAALFESALTLTGDSARLQHFAAVGLGRALLALGRYSEAAVAVAAVPDAFAYQVVPTTTLGRAFPTAFTRGISGSFGSIGTPTVGNREGLNGLVYRTSGDPRTPAVRLATVRQGAVPTGDTVYAPAKYHPAATGAYTYRIASGIEARLIEAEAALQAGSDWLTKLNALRTDGTFTTQSTTDPNDDPAAMDTLWNAGSGGVARLRPLDDPGASLSDPMSAKDARVDMVFRERAFWLYMTGHRHGDLRRLVREYQRLPETVFPRGFYPGGNGTYGTDVVFSVPERERQLNPKYSGCFHGEA